MPSTLPRRRKTATIHELTGRITAAFAKSADMGDSGQDASFEQDFSNLAHAYLKENAPGLMDYEVGFQLIDRDDDKAKAAGAFGFKVGGTWLIGPVFFINGNLKGHELLYIKNQDAVVPMEEGWISYLMSKKPPSLGEDVTRDSRQLGVQHPDLFRALQSPHKYAALRGTEKAAAVADAAIRSEAEAIREKAASTDMDRVATWPDWAVAGVTAMAKFAARDDGDPSRLLPRVLKRAGVDGVDALRGMLATYPALVRTFDECYDRADIADALEAIKLAALTPAPAKERRVKKATRWTSGSIASGTNPVEDGRLRVYEFNGFDDVPLVLDRADREVLIRDRVLIKDARADDEVTKAYAVPVKTDFPRMFRNPTDSGLYETLVQGGDLRKCLVIVGPAGPDKSYMFSTVIDLEGKKRKQWVNIHQAYIWVRKEYMGWRDWFEDLPDPDSCEPGKEYIAVGPNGTGSLPFVCEKSLGNDAAGAPTYEVHFERGSSKSRPNLVNVPNSELKDSSVDHYDIWRDGQRIHLHQPTGSKLRSTRGDLYIPVGFKLIPLAHDIVDPTDAIPERDAVNEGQSPEVPSEEERFDGEADIPKNKGTFPTTSAVAMSDDPPLNLGNNLDVEVGITRKFASLTLTPYPGGMMVDDIRCTEKQALLQLVCGHGFREDEARDLIEEASATPRPREFLVKFAAPYQGSPYLTDGGPYAPSMVDPTQGYNDTSMGNVPAQYPSQMALPVPDMQAGQGNRDAYDPMLPDPQASQMAQQSSESGQKELFDASMVANVIRSTSDDNLVDEDIPDMKKALDRVGRQLMKFYWNSDKYAERYGDADMPDLEDSIRNTFRDLGKLVLFFMRKTVVADPVESARDVNLSDIAG